MKKLEVARLKLDILDSDPTSVTKLSTFNILPKDGMNELLNNYVESCHASASEQKLEFSPPEMPPTHYTCSPSVVPTETVTQTTRVINPPEHTLYHSGPVNTPSTGSTTCFKSETPRPISTVQAGAGVKDPVVKLKSHTSLDPSVPAYVPINPDTVGGQQPSTVQIPQPSIVTQYMPQPVISAWYFTQPTSSVQNTFAPTVSTQFPTKPSLPQSTISTQNLLQSTTSMQYAYQPTLSTQIPLKLTVPTTPTEHISQPIMSTQCYAQPIASQP